MATSRARRLDFYQLSHRGWIASQTTATYIELAIGRKRISEPRPWKTADGGRVSKGFSKANQASLLFEFLCFWDPDQVTAD